MTDIKPFGELSEAEQNKLFQAWLKDRTCLEFYQDSPTFARKWSTCLDPSWHATSWYRIKQTPDTIDWSHIIDKYNYMARDSFGRVQLYANKPRLVIDHWGWSHVRPVDATIFGSYKQGTVDWKDSLVVRPGCSEESSDK